MLIPYIDQLISQLDQSLPEHPVESDLARTQIFGSTATLMRLRKSGKGPPHIKLKLGRVYYPKATFLQWVRENCEHSMAGPTAKADA